MATQDQRHENRAQADDLDLGTHLLPTHAPDQQDVARYCPECDMPTWVEWSDGGHVKLRCFARHWFLMLDPGA
ncbi:MAG TPA: hypothetical protein VFN43_09190 [Humibacillus sp.]|nr:hypothetical protein [Humibacillus sp.]